jgi:hypothetical protein
VTDFDEEPCLHDVAETAKEHSRVLFALLVSLVHGLAINILMSTEKSNGLQGWRRLKRE